MVMKALSLATILLVGLALHVTVIQPSMMPYVIAQITRPMVPYMITKITRGAPCSWANLARMPSDMERLIELQLSYFDKVQLIASDDRLGIAQFSTPTRHFWAKKGGEFKDGRSLLVYVLAENDWIMSRPRAVPVRAGDVVVDVGAHVGTFGDDALRRGASKVVMIEPDPVNVECIRRNFSKEIASGKVTVIPEGAWSSQSVMSFGVGRGNSGTGSLVLKEDGAKTIDVPVRPIDDMLRQAGVEKVDFFKFDIEGAEREALKGAAVTLARWRPRIMLDAYHRPDDAEVLPAVILSANPGYRYECALCAVHSHSRDVGRAIVPYAIFYQ